MSSKLRAEQKAVALAQRRMESVRVLRALFERIEVFSFTIIPTLCSSDPTSSQLLMHHIQPTDQGCAHTPPHQEREWRVVRTAQTASFSRRSARDRSEGCGP